MSTQSLAKNVAILIDSEGIDPQFIEYIFSESNRFGIIRIKRVYGNWANEINKWDKSINQFAIRPIYTFSNNENVINITLAIDVMEILNSKQAEVVCVISYKEDYTDLMFKIREKGYEAIGFGPIETKKRFRQSCDRFKFYGLKQMGEPKKTNRLEGDKQILIDPRDELMDYIQSIDLDSINSAFNSIVNTDTELAQISKFIPALRNINTEFGEISNYNCENVRMFCKQFDEFYEFHTEADGITNSLRLIY